MLEITYWLSVPCPIQANVLREFAELPGCAVKVICHQDIQEYRKRDAGWRKPDFGKAQVEILPDCGWQRHVDKIVSTSSKSIHVFNGLIRLPKFAYTRKRAFRLRYQTGAVTECLVNQEKGIKRVAKSAYLKISERIHRPIVKHMHFVLAISHKGDSSFRKLGWSEEKIYPYGYFVETLPPSGVQTARKDTDIVQLLYCGMLVPKKRVDILLHALHLLKQKDSHFRCRIIGNGPCRSELLQLARKLELGKCVEFLGALPNTEAKTVMKECDIIVLPGLREPWGVPVNEGIQSGLAVVVSDGIGASDLVRFSGAGRIFKGGNINSLADALYSLVCNPTELINAKERAKAYAPKLSPKLIATYLRDVILHATDRRIQRPIPPWW